MSGWRKKQIQELIDRSGIYIAYENKSVTEKELEALAESIVRECVVIVESQGRFLTYDKLALKIKEHFGVEK